MEEVKEPTVSQARAMRESLASGSDYAKAEAFVFIGLAIIYLAKVIARRPMASKSEGE